MIHSGTGAIPFIGEGEFDLVTPAVHGYATEPADSIKDVSVPYSVSSIEIAVQLLNRFIQRELNRKMITMADAPRFKNKLGKLAIETDGSMPVFAYEQLERKGSKVRKWSLNTGIIECMPNDQLVKFINETTKAYIAAKTIEPMLLNNKNQVFEKTMDGFEEWFSRRVVEILAFISTYEIPYLQ